MSFPSRERGLKPASRERGLKPVHTPPGRIFSGSFPSRERGLKLLHVWHILHVTPVVPLAGTWIETLVSTLCNTRACVVPLAGTWIETILPHNIDAETWSRSPRGNVD